MGSDPVELRKESVEAMPTLWHDPPPRLSRKLGALQMVLVGGGIR